MAIISIIQRLFGGTTQSQCLAKGRGFTFEIVGESNYQDAFLAALGEKTEDGYNLPVHAAIKLADGAGGDPYAIAVELEGRLVGYVPRAKCQELRRDLRRLGIASGAVQCHAKIKGGWDRGGDDEGSFGIWLNLSSPLRLEQS